MKIFKSVFGNRAGSCGGSFAGGLRWLGHYSPLRGCSGPASLAAATISRCRTPLNSQTRFKASLVSSGGFTLMEMMIVVGILGLVSAIAMPNFLKARAITQTKICIENLAQIESAKQIWGLENGKKDGDAATDGDIFGPNAYIKIKPPCPMGGDYDLTTIGVNATCTIPGHAL